MPRGPRMVRPKISLKCSASVGCAMPLTLLKVFQASVDQVSGVDANSVAVGQVGDEAPAAAAKEERGRVALDGVAADAAQHEDRGAAADQRARLVAYLVGLVDRHLDGQRERGLARHAATPSCLRR